MNFLYNIYNIMTSFPQMITEPHFLALITDDTHADLDILRWETHGYDSDDGHYVAYRLEPRGHVVQIKPKYSRENKRDAAVPALADIESHALVIPCDDASLKRIFDWHAMTVSLNALPGPANALYSGRMPLYATFDMTRNRRKEPKRNCARLFNGPVSKEMLATINRNRDLYEFQLTTRTTLPKTDPYAKKIPFARYNCLTLPLGIIEHVAGIDLDAIDPSLSRFISPLQLNEWLETNINEAPRACKYSRQEICDEDSFIHECPEITFLADSNYKYPCFVTDVASFYANDLSGQWMHHAQGDNVATLMPIITGKQALPAPKYASLIA